MVEPLDKPFLTFIGQQYYQIAIMSPEEIEG